MLLRFGTVFSLAEKMQDGFFPFRLRLALRKKEKAGTNFVIDIDSAQVFFVGQAASDVLFAFTPQFFIITYVRFGKAVLKKTFSASTEGARFPQPGSSCLGTRLSCHRIGL